MNDVHDRCVYLLKSDTLSAMTFILNHVPSKLVTTTPYKLWTGCKMDLTVLTTMRVSVLFPKTCFTSSEMLRFRGLSIFVRYFMNSKRYVFISENEDGSVTEVESRNAIFIEKDFPSR